MSPERIAWDHMVTREPNMRELEEIGLEGWELVTIISYGRWVFKRPMDHREILALKRRRQRDALKATEAKRQREELGSSDGDRSTRSSDSDQGVT
jgi:hypothetical protein